MTALAIPPIPMTTTPEEMLAVGIKTEQLNSFFQSNADNLKLGTERQYFAHTSGLTRFYPGGYWDQQGMTRNTYRAEELLTYDPRIEPWYQKSMTVKKDLLIIMI